MNIKIYDALLLVDVLENFRKMCSDIYELHPAKFISAPKLAWQVTLIKTQVKSDLSTNLDVLLYAFKWPERVFEEYAKANNKYMEDYHENKESSYLTGM